MATTLRCTADIDDSTVCDSVHSGNVTTSDNTPTLIASFTVPTDHNISCLNRVILRRTDAGGVGDMYSAQVNCGFKNIAGTVTQVGSTVTTPVQSSPSTTVSISATINGETIELYVTGENNKTFNWRLIGQTFYYA